MKYKIIETLARSILLSLGIFVGFAAYNKFMLGELLLPIIYFIAAIILIFCGLVLKDVCT